MKSLDKVFLWPSSSSPSLSCAALPARMPPLRSDADGKDRDTDDMLRVLRQVAVNLALYARSPFDGMDRMYSAAIKA